MDELAEAASTEISSAVGTVAEEERKGHGSARFVKGALHRSTRPFCTSREAVLASSMWALLFESSLLAFTVQSDLHSNLSPAS